MQKGLWTRQYLDNTELSPNEQKKKGNHDLKVVFELNHNYEQRGSTMLNIISKT